MNSNHKKKLALVNVFFAPQSIGGATRVISDNFDILLDKYSDEYEIVVFTSDVNMLEKPYQMMAYNYQGVRVYRTSVVFREHMDWYATDESMGEVFTEFLDFEKPDLIHFHCVQRLTASIVESAIMRAIPYIITAHDAWWISDYQFLVDESGQVFSEGHMKGEQRPLPPKGITQADADYRLRFLSFLLEHAESVVTVSEGFKKIYENSGVTNMKVTKNGISELTDWQSKNTSHSDKVICAHIGGMSNHKGYHLFQKALKEQQPNNIEALIVDHSKPSDYVKKDSWGVVPVTYIGRAKQENIVSLYQSIDVLFAPSIWPESFGLVTREAAACGCWVVASNMGGIGEDVIDGQSGFVIEPTQQALEEVIEQIDGDPVRYKDIAIGNEIHYVTEQVDELVEIYRGVLG